MSAGTVVFNISKIQIESNSQLYLLCGVVHIRCVQYFKDTNRKQFTTNSNCSISSFKLCSIFQRYKSKAIHNEMREQRGMAFVVFNISKIQIESNSQRDFVPYTGATSCVQYFKDTNRKQFTTQLLMLHLIQPLCSIFQRYKSKAIHNATVIARF